MVRVQERGCSFINVKEQDAVTEKQALMVTDKNRQIHTIHPAATREESSWSIRNHKTDGAKAFSRFRSGNREQATWLRNPTPGPDSLSYLVIHPLVSSSSNETDKAKDNHTHRQTDSNSSSL